LTRIAPALYRYTDKRTPILSGLVSSVVGKLERHTVDKTRMPAV